MAGVRVTPYYDEDGITIFRASAGALPVAGASVAAVVTSPPYNVGVAYDEHDDVLPWDAYWDLVAAWAQEMERVLVHGGRCWVNVAPVVQEEPGGHGRNGPHSGRSLKVRQSLVAGWSNALTAAGLRPADMVAWTSQRGSGTAWGSWEMPSAPNLRGDWEAVLVFYKGAWVRQPPVGLESWRDKEGGWPALVSNVWNVRPEVRDEHPAPFPLEVAARAIRLSTWPGETVCDPFMGSGTTLRAAADRGRRAVGVDVSARYCEMAANRLAQGVLAL